MDEFAILCEQCGYPLAGLPGGAACPECARPAALSDPARRAGSPWQRRAGLLAWITTGVMAVTSPSELGRALRIHGRGWGLLGINIVLAAMLIAAPWSGVFVGDPLRGSPPVHSAGQIARVGLVLAAQVLPIAGVLWVLTWIEVVGVRFFSRRKGWRLTRAGAWQVCAHASYGWIFSGVLPMLLLAALFALQRTTGVAPGGTFSLAPLWNTRIAWYELIGVGGPLLGYFAGMMIFEMLVYRGVRACRYAATVREG